MLQAAPVSHYSDRTLYILYRVLNKHINNIVTDKSQYYNCKEGEKYLSYYIYVMNRYYKIPISQIASSIPFAEQWCESILRKFKAPQKFLQQINQYNAEYEIAKNKLFKV
jgi:hypothetical protein